MLAVVPGLAQRVRVGEARASRPAGAGPPRRSSWPSAAAASARELAAVVAAELHDPRGGAQLPQVVRGVVAEARRARVGGARGAAASSRSRPGRRARRTRRSASAAVGAQDALEVAHAHVVGDEGEVLAAEALAVAIAGSARWPSSACAGSKRWSTARAPRSQRARLGRGARAALAGDAPRVAAALAATSIRMPSRFWPVSARICVSPTAPSVPLGDRVRAPGALEEDERLEAVGVDAGAPRGRARSGGGSARRARRSPRRRRASARTAGGSVPAAARALELLAALGVVGERVRQRRAAPRRSSARRASGRPAGRPAAAGPRG